MRLFSATGTPGSSLSTACVVLAAVCWGLSGGIAGVLMSRGWDPFVLAFYRGAIGLLFVLVWLILRPRRSGFTNGRLWLWAGVAGLGVAGNFAFYFISITNASVAVAATLMYCAPVYVYLVSFAFGFEASSASKWAAIVMVMAGVVLLTGVYDVDARDITPLGVVAGLLSGLCYAAFIFGFRNATAHGSPQAILTIAFAALVAILFWPGDPLQTTAALSSPDWPLFIVLGVLGAGLSFFLYVIGMRGEIPTIAAIVAMVEPITASLFGVVVLGESLTALQLVGMALILVTVTALSVHSNG